MTNLLSQLAVGAINPKYGSIGSPEKSNTGVKLIDPPFLDISRALPAVLNLAFSIAAILLVILILIGGLQYLASAGNEESSTKARRLLTSAVIGFVLIVGSWSIMVFAFYLLRYKF